MVRDLSIAFESQSFPAGVVPHWGRLDTNWDEILWAALTIGRPDHFHVFRHGSSSLHEAIFRLALIRMAIQEDWNGSLRRTDAFQALDPTEKGMISYFLGMTVCKLFASRLLRTPWLLHLDVFKERLVPVLGGPVNLGRSRPDLVGQDLSKSWTVFELKGRSSPPTFTDKQKAKAQAARLVSVGGVNCTLHVGSFAFFRNDLLEFFWVDPEPGEKDLLSAPEPREEWAYYYQSSLAFSVSEGGEMIVDDRSPTDVQVSIHPTIKDLLLDQRWEAARNTASEMREELNNAGFQADGVKVKAGDSWKQPYEFREKGWR